MRALEIYSDRGALLGVYSLPSGDANLISADAHGRLVFSEGTRDLPIVRDPSSQVNDCPTLPHRIVVGVLSTVDR